MMDIDGANIAIMASGIRILVISGEGADADCFAGINLDATEREVRMHSHVSCMWDRSKVARLEGIAGEGFKEGWTYQPLSDAQQLEQALKTAITIGPATLYLGDAYQIRPTLGFMDADVMDPPYAFNNSGGGAFRKARGASDQIVDEGLDRGFDRTIINPLLCGAAVVFCHQDQLPDLLTYLNGGFHRFALLHWIKPNPSPMANKHYLADTEPFIHAWNRGYHPQGVHHDKHRHITAGTTPRKLYGHPTVKPAEVMNKIMRNVAGETVCDPFMGTGSTGVAALLHGKRFFGIEKNPTHFQTAVARITEVWQRVGTEAA